jgi:carbon monoxide dehydrogenase subunit G
MVVFSQVLRLAVVAPGRVYRRVKACFEEPTCPESTMQTEVKVTIATPRADVWRLITDIDNSVNTISGITEIEVLERPDQGLVGLMWVETRVMFGREATETMRITAAVEGESYEVRAESHGAIYLSTLALRDVEGGTELTMRFGAQPTTFVAKLMGATIGRLFVGATRKALQQDLEDIKAAAEARAA